MGIWYFYTVLDQIHNFVGCILFALGIFIVMTTVYSSVEKCMNKSENTLVNLRYAYIAFAILGVIFVFTPHDMVYNYRHNLQDDLLKEKQTNIQLQSEIYRLKLNSTCDID